MRSDLPLPDSPVPDLPVPDLPVPDLPAPIVRTSTPRSGEPTARATSDPNRTGIPARCARLPGFAVPPDVNDGGDLDAALGQCEGRPVGVVMGDEKDGWPTRRHRVPDSVGLGRAGQHHAGPVIAGKGDDPLDHSRLLRDRAGPDHPLTLAHGTWGRLGKIVGGSPTAPTTPWS